MQGIISFAETNGRQDHTAVKQLPLQQFRAGTLTRTDTYVFKVPQLKCLDSAKGIDHKDLFKLRCTLGCGAVFHIELGPVFVNLPESLFVLGDGDETKLIAITEFHASKEIEPSFTPHFNKIQRS
ncbi:hypothetical protein D3C71_1142560 [compost metagenome]